MWKKLLPAALLAACEAQDPIFAMVCDDQGVYHYDPPSCPTEMFQIRWPRMPLRVLIQVPGYEEPAARAMALWSEFLVPADTDYEVEVWMRNDSPTRLSDAWHIDVGHLVGLIEIHDPRSPAQFVNTLAHDYGRILGLADDANPESVMYPFSGEEPREVEEQDLDALRDLYHL